MIQIASVKSRRRPGELRVWVHRHRPPKPAPDLQLGHLAPSRQLVVDLEQGDCTYEQFADQYARQLSACLDEMMLEEISAQAARREVVVVHDQGRTDRRIATAFAAYLQDLQPLWPQAKKG